MFHRTEFRPGHLLAVTSCSRILWLRDEDQGRWERYAGIAASAPTWLLQSCLDQKTSKGHELKIEFKTGAPWHIRIYDDDLDCREFADNVNAYVYKLFILRD